MENSTSKFFEDEVVDSILEDLEVTILKVKNEIKGIVGNSIRTIAERPRRALYNDITPETEDLLEKDIRKYKEKLVEIQNLRKIHNYIMKNREGYAFFFENWVSRENTMMDELNDYIIKNFTKKELTKDDI